MKHAASRLLTWHDSWDLAQLDSAGVFALPRWLLLVSHRVTAASL